MIFSPKVTKVPSKHQLDNLLQCYQMGNWRKAEILATSLTNDFPKHPFGWKVLGALFI